MEDAENTEIMGKLWTKEMKGVKGKDESGERINVKRLVRTKRKKIKQKQQMEKQIKKKQNELTVVHSVKSIWVTFKKNKRKKTKRKRKNKTKNEIRKRKRKTKGKTK